jgi:hypothetical protein
MYQAHDGDREPVSQSSKTYRRQRGTTKDGHDLCVTEAMSRVHVTNDLQGDGWVTHNYLGAVTKYDTDVL